MADQLNWKTCHDKEHGFSLSVPPDWRSTTGDERCVQFQRGTSELPQGVPEIDVFIRVEPVSDNFPKELPNSPGVQYTEHQQREINGLPAVRGSFQSSGPVPNSGIEYAVRKDNRVLRIYVSQPSAAVEKLFDEVVSTLRW